MWASRGNAHRELGAHLDCLTGSVWPLGRSRGWSLTDDAED